MEPWTVLDGAQVGLIVVSAFGHVVRTNRTAEAILAAEDGLRCVGGVLTAERREDARALRTLITQAATGGVTSDGETIGIRRERGRPLAVTCTPWARSDGASPGIFIYVVDTDRRGMPVAGQMMRLFGLTAAEARVADLLGQGRTVQEVAAALQTSVHTVRAQLKQVLAKTETDRQAALVLLLSRLAAFTPCHAAVPHGGKPAPA